MREVGVLEAKTNLSALLDAVETDGEEIVITRNGKAVAKLSIMDRSPPPRRRNGAEIVARMQKLHERMVRENPEILNITWEEIKGMADE
ncbi:type II toxin-antitoxin system Phd/YefM family antitoxin [Phenylobacterium sp.]|uniref:type II toxin-antitoxin system Phd/YefM family antitoxin n=1 Tax=Phenylobacterium sp. TaxID=1871053 RepID=UPI00374CA886